MNATTIVSIKQRNRSRETNDQGGVLIFDNNTDTDTPRHLYVRVNEIQNEGCKRDLPALEDPPDLDGGCGCKRNSHPGILPVLGNWMTEVGFAKIGPRTSLLLLSAPLVVLLL